MFSLSGFAILRVLGQQRGVADANALNRIALIGGVVGLTPLGIIVGDSLIRNELESEKSTTLSTGGTTISTVQAEVPDVRLKSFADAQTQLQSSPRQFSVTRVNAFSERARDIVIDQDPQPNHAIPVGSNVTLTVSTGGGGQSDTAVKDTVARVAGKIGAISDEVVEVVPTVGPHVVAAIQAVTEFARHAAQPPQPQPQNSAPVNAKSKRKATRKEEKQTSREQPGDSE